MCEVVLLGSLLGSLLVRSVPASLLLVGDCLGLDNLSAAPQGTEGSGSGNVAAALDSGAALLPPGPHHISCCWSP